MTDISAKMNLSGKVAIVTGALGGIGKATVKALLREGATVVASDFEETSETAEKLFNGSVLPIDCNITDESDVQNLIDNAVKEYGRIDIIVHCAGIYETTHEEDLTLESWERMLKVNLTGTFLVTNTVFKQMKKQQSGKIICLASNAGQTGGDMAGLHYSASKGGVIAYTKRLAKAGGPNNIHVNAIAPGPVQSDMMKGLDVNTENFPLGRIGTPKDVAETAVFLSSQASEFITGQIIGVNGGLVI